MKYRALLLLPLLLSMPTACTQQGIDPGATGTTAGAPSAAGHGGQSAAGGASGASSAAGASASAAFGSLSAGTGAAMVQAGSGGAGGGGGATNPAAGGEGGAGSNAAGAGEAGAPAAGRPDGVSICYSSLSSAHPATLDFWAVFRAGALDRRPMATAALAQAAREHPQEEEFALLHGLASLWRVAEPAAGEELDPFGFLDAVAMAQSELERAYQLCPTDHRIPAWLGPVLVNAGRATDDQAMVDEGLRVLQRGIDHYPAFVLFSRLLVFADRPKSDPDFKQASDAVTANIAACTPSDPACSNHAHVAHNMEGAAVFLGDVLAKAGDRERARATYTEAMAVAEYDAWDYRDLLEARLAMLDARSAAFDTPDTADDPESAWNATNQCSICHRE